MINLSGYSVTDLIFSGTSSAVYRGESRHDNTPVIIKVINIENPTHADIARVNREYEIARNISLEGVVRPVELIPFRQGYALVFEDFGGMALNTFMAGHKVPLLSCLQISVELARTLGNIHQKGIVHKDIKPSNIIFNNETGEVKLTDFSVASQIFGERQTFVNPDLLEGTLNYISPEQTGRMNRSIDHRADLYSFGVTLYELLTGVLPFRTSDAMELIHCHMAIQPSAPHELDRAIPKPLSDIVMKLLEKNADQRYRSAFGLMYDLEGCLVQFSVSGTVEPFVLGARDVPTTLQIPEKLYGREAELAELLNAFSRVTRGKAEMLFVKGSPGIGKSALINKLHKPVSDRKGYFAAGKFEQFKRDVPYDALQQAFKDLVRQLLIERTERVDEWKERIQEALGPNGQIIVDLIPEIELIIGHQQPVEPLPPTQSQNRFNMVFAEFVRVFAQPKHPLVLFLDDMQWVDWATLKLVEVLVTTHGIGSLLIIGTYRDNEVDPAHPLMLTLDDVIREGISVSEIQLKLLPLEGLVMLLDDTLACGQSAARALASVVMDKTLGNPLFINQFLKGLYQKHLIRFDTDEYRWAWNAEDIRAQESTGNVVEFMCGKILELSPSAQSTIATAACIGNRFDLDLLVQVSGMTFMHAAEALLEAQREGLIVPIGTAYKYVETLTEEDSRFLSTEENRIPYMFLHDRIQQAAYSLIPEKQKIGLHYEVGRILLEQTPAGESQERLFETVEHLNKSVEQISDSAELAGLAGLNLDASRKAKASNAYDTALQFATRGLALLDEDRWRSHYTLTRDLNMERAEYEYLTGSFDKAESVLAEVLENIRTDIEKAEVYYLKSLLYAHLDRQMDAVSAGLDGLRLLGIKVSSKQNKLSVAIEFIMAFLRLRGRPPEALLLLPEMTDPRQRLASRILISTITPAYFADQDMFEFLCLKGFNLTLKYGLTDSSPFMFLSYGFALADKFGAYRTAYDFALAARTLNEKLPNALLRCKVTALLGFFFSHWRKPMAEGMDHVKRAFKYAVEAGDLIYAGLASDTLILYLLAKGRNIDEHLAEMENYTDFVNRSEDQFSIDFHRLKNQVLKNLKGQTEDRLSLSDKDYDEGHMLQRFKDEYNANLLSHYHLWKGMILYLNGEFARASTVFAEGRKYAHGVALLPSNVDACFFESLALAALWPEMGLGQKLRGRATMSRNLRRLRKWSDSCPSNSLPKYLLVKAEMKMISGNQMDAIELYDKSVFSARKYGFIQVEALANELSSRLHFSSGREPASLLYIREAFKCYRKWGVEAKARELAELHGFSLGTEQEKDRTPTSSSSLRQIDLAAVLSASQNISEEIVLGGLLKGVMQIAIKNAGARKGFLILNKDGKLLIEAEGHSDKEDYKVLQSIPVEESDGLSSAIVSYVGRTMEALVLQNASEEGLFVSDSYVKNNQSKSIICVPIIKQKKLTGVLYLENDLLTDAFTRDRLEVLSMLATQAAISIENAKLYDDVELRVQQLQQAEEEQRRLYSQLLQAQKMESIGRLAGGVAHDFNNLLTSIIGYSEMIFDSLQDSDPMKEKIESILDSGNRAASLTSQLLAFSRKQLLVMKVVNLNSIVENMSKMIGRIIGEDISLEIRPHAGELNVLADARQIEQVLLNLAVNSRDAMPRGGSLVIETTVDNVVEGSALNKRELKLGHYAVMRVSDSGVGIPLDVREKIFEPFFTTKEVDKGTGLGLATVYGIVKQHNGLIEVDSIPGKGTWFTLYLPMAMDESEEPSTDERVLPPHGIETVLVVDDEENIRRLALDTLRPLGYELLDAPSGEEALAISNSSKGEIHLLLTDVIMPGMTGYELADKIKLKRPGIKVIFISGYLDDKIPKVELEKPDVIFIQKPLSPKKLALRIREILDRKA